MLEDMHLDGVEAFLRVPLVQMQRDRKAGWQTAAWVSGYRGTTLKGLEQLAAASADRLAEFDIRVEPGLNEELAANAIWGTQQASLSPRASHRGVVGLWYGSGSGIGRCGEVLRQGNAAGSTAFGGALCLSVDQTLEREGTLRGDSVAHFIAAGMPVLQAGGIDDLVLVALTGIALSRFSGSWVGWRMLRETMNTAGSVSLVDEQRRFRIPDGVPNLPGGRNLCWPAIPAEQRASLQSHRLQAARAFMRENSLDEALWRDARSRLGIVVAANDHPRLLQVLTLLGLDEPTSRKIGLCLYRVYMVWPLEPESIAGFADGLDELLVIEDELGPLSAQLARQLYAWPPARRPRLSDCAEAGRPSGVSASSALDRLALSEQITRRLLCLSLPEDVRRRLEQGLETARQQALARSAPMPMVERQARFCAGCSHNRATRVPEGSTAMAGNGCHRLVTRMDRRTPIGAPMGGEGVAWIGIAPHTQETHRFANLGDGSWTHSGLLAVRASVAAGVNITYRILCNDVSALSGGGSARPIDAVSIVHQLLAEGVSPVHVFCDEPGRLLPAALPSEIVVRPRAALDEVQQGLRGSSGCSAIVDVQPCAAYAPKAPSGPGQGSGTAHSRRVFIHADICDACGECNREANCVAIEPLDTAMGRKRHIEQSLCSGDLACLDVHCPAIVMIEGGQRCLPWLAADPSVENAGASTEELPMPDPEMLTQRSCNMVLAGMAGEGVDALTRLLGIAAHRDGRRVVGWHDEYGPPRAEAVFGHVRIGVDARSQTGLVADGEADLLIATDAVAAVSTEGLSVCNARRTEAILNRTMVPLSTSLAEREFDLQQGELEATAARSSRSGAHFHRFGQAAAERMGDRSFTGLVMLGYAWQLGLIPIRHHALLWAIRHCESKRQSDESAFAWGRRLALQPALFSGKVGSEHDTGSIEEARREVASLEGLIAQRRDYLTDYQDEELARHYTDRVWPFVRRCEALGLEDALPRLVVDEYARLLAIRDEYEIARLYCLPSFRRALRQTFGQGYRVRFHFALPRWLGRRSGGERPVRQFGIWILPVLWLLQRARRWRGTRKDLFGKGADRQADRDCIAWYEQDMAFVQEQLSEENLERALLLMSATTGIRGFGPARRQAIARAATIRHAAREKFADTGQAVLRRAA